jgi:hypothetical protein
MAEHLATKQVTTLGFALVDRIGAPMAVMPVVDNLSLFLDVKEFHAAESGSTRYGSPRLEEELSAGV